VPLVFWALVLISFLSLLFSVKSPSLFSLMQGRVSPLVLRKTHARSYGFESLEVRRLMAFDPSAIEQELMQLINRFRTDPKNEFDRMIAVASPIQARDPLVTEQLRIAGVNGNVLKQELQALTPVAPLAWSEVMYNLAAEQNRVMLANGSQVHTSYSLSRRLYDMNVGLDPDPSDQLYRAGQNAFDSGKSPSFISAAYVIDWGGPDAGMQIGRGHRTTLMRNTYTQAATPIMINSSVKGPLWNTQFFARINSAKKMAVGAVYEDKNKSGWYDAGEGVGNVQIEFRGAAGTFRTTAMSAGGYQIELPPGTYSATASGGTLNHAIVLPSVTVGSANVWANFVYDRSVIPADAFEPNNSLATATPLVATDQTLSNLSLHAGDVDYYRFVANGTGNAIINLSFNNANGNLDLRLLDGSGKVLAASTTNKNLESVAVSVTRGSSYFVQVYSAANATNPNYSLQLDLPEPARPIAGADRVTWESDRGPLTISILDNDTDPDGPASALAPSLLSSAGGAFVVKQDRTLSFTPPSGYSGVARATYSVTDDQGLVSAPANIEVFVLSFANATPWRNSRNPLDTNDDGFITPFDALLIISELNARGARLLPQTLEGSTELFGFLDTNGSGRLEPRDALLVINEINRVRRSGGAAEGELSGDDAVDKSAAIPSRHAAHDSAVLQLWGAAVADDLERKKRL
jgi:hypothetical protein